MGLPFLSRGNFWCYESTTVFCAFIFICLFETMVRKNTWIRTTSVTVMVIFSKLLLWKLLDHDFFLNNYETPWQNGILETFHSWRFYGNGSTYVLFISWLSINTQKLKKLPGKFSFAQKTKPVLRRTLNQNKIGHLTYCCMLLFCSNKLSF